MTTYVSAGQIPLDSRWFIADLGVPVPNPAAKKGRFKKRWPDWTELPALTGMTAQVEYSHRSPGLLRCNRFLPLPWEYLQLGFQSADRTERGVFYQVGVVEVSRRAPDEESVILELGIPGGAEHPAFNFWTAG